MGRLISVEVQGLPALKRRLIQIIPAKVRIAVEAAMIEGADRVVTQAKALAPRDSGELAASIHATGVREGKNGSLYVAITEGVEERHATGTFNRARLVEFGTQGRPAEPHFFPAWRSNKARIRRRIRDAIKRTVAEN